MSAIASFYLLERSAVPGLVEAAKAKATIPVAPTQSDGRRRRFAWSRRPAPLMVSPVSNYLQENDLGVSGGLFDWSGYALLDLMLVLEETGTRLGEAEYRAETEAVSAAYGLTYLITSADKSHLTALDPARLDRAAAARLLEGEHGGFEEMRQAIDDGLILLHRLIAALHDNEVLVIHIG